MHSTPAVLQRLLWSSRFDWRSNFATRLGATAAAVRMACAMHMCAGHPRHPPVVPPCAQGTTRTASSSQKLAAVAGARGFASSDAPPLHPPPQLATEAMGRCGARLRHAHTALARPSTMALHKGLSARTCRVQPTLALAFTCAKCGTRSVETFSRQAYERGVVMVGPACAAEGRSVVARTMHERRGKGAGGLLLLLPHVQVKCRGAACGVTHLIADHLGWFGDKGWTIEALQAQAATQVATATGSSPEDAGPCAPTAHAAGAAKPGAVTQVTEEERAGWRRVQQLLHVAMGGRGGGGLDERGMPGGAGLSVVDVTEADFRAWGKVGYVHGFVSL